MLLFLYLLIHRLTAPPELQFHGNESLDCVVHQDLSCSQYLMNIFPASQ